MGGKGTEVLIAYSGKVTALNTVGSGTQKI